MGDLFSGFTSGLSNLFGGGNQLSPSIQNLPQLPINTMGLGTTPVDTNLFGGFGDFLTSQGGQGLLKTGVGGLSALGNYNLGQKGLDLASRAEDRASEAYAQDRADAEARRNLRF